MKAAQRREIADRVALIAVDRFEAFCRTLPCNVFPEELLEMQHDIEDDIYRELGGNRAA
jgi:DNA-binding Xre family transcriptional regulator